ncbi:MAG: molybdopterin-dependent oxidoreductase [Verrucomicrobia bacterium]|jgi:NADH-quinone oxidoreductase subunit G|nr:molybdopterin-dependent oxidoreductase [Verrucomicrobiota bacterium]
MSAAPTSETKPAPPPVETLTVKVDDRRVTVPKLSPDHTGKLVPTTMIQACFAAGTMVPHYCYHPKLPVAGNCRMCLVEFGTPALGPDRKPILNPDGTPKITKSPRPAIACATPISPGMEIYCSTPSVKQMREGVLESLLINHPLDCPICDQAGECKLQEYSVDYGQSASRFVEAKVHKPKRIDLGPRIVFDAERCILCTRCIRFTRDVAGDDALGIVNRGSYNTISTFPGQPFDNNYTLNTVDLCPVGALTSKDFRFQMRVWFLKETKSLCTSCATGCNVTVGSRENRVYRYEPRENEAVNGPWMCDAGRLHYKWINREDRLKEVRVRGEKSTWTAALQEIAGKLKSAPKGSVAIVASARQTNEELFLLKKLATRLEAITDSVPRLGRKDALLLDADKNPNTNGARLNGMCFTEVGINLSKIAAGIESGQIKTLLVFGENLLQHGVRADELAAAEITSETVQKHGLTAELLSRLETLIVSDILPGPTTLLAHYLLPGCAHVEKRGTFTNTKGRVQKFMKAIEPPGDARPEWEFLLELVQSVAGREDLRTLEGLFNRMAREVPAFQGLTWAGLGDTGTTVEI